MGGGAEAEFMKVQFVDVSGHNFESSQACSFRIQCLRYTNQFFKPLLLKGGGGGVKSVSRGDC